MEKLSQKEWDKDSLTKKVEFILEENKIHITHLFQWLEKFLLKCIESLIILFNKGHHI
tara:strand:- start:44 stop:217 length:174 start_codon:yes stop_codon:yes gene_type:complete